MKKIFLFVSILAASMGLVACTEDYTDWNAPQANEQESALGAISASIAPVSGDVKYEAAEETISLLEMTASQNALDGSSVVFTKLIVNETEEIAFATEGSVLTVSKEDLNNAVKRIFKSQAYTSCELTLQAQASLVSPTGTATPVSFDPVKITYLPKPLPASVNDEMFYYIGTAQGWDIANPTPLTNNGDGTWSLTQTVGDSDWFKFIPKSAVEAGDWSGLFGCAENGSTAATDFIVENGESMMIEKGGTYIFTIDLVNFTYTIVPAKAIYFPVGTPTDWNGGEKTSSFYPQSFTVHTYTAYFTGAWDLKIWKQADFANWDACLGTAIDGDGSQSGSLVTSGAGCLQSPEAGYYTLTVDFLNLTYYWTKLDNQSPTDYSSISMAGGFNGWGDTDMTRTHADKNTHNWYYLGLSIPENTEIKFKANHGWDINWGASVDLSKQFYGKGEANGSNITIPAGVYNVYFNDITGEFVFETVE